MITNSPCFKSIGVERKKIYGFNKISQQEEAVNVKTIN